ncbi:MAG: MurR/RpiR family transcriptional regulator [Solobacterium sp.]|nr:MurR/RpiR family transcriptional regulator [Solobacterium sp.]
MDNVYNVLNNYLKRSNRNGTNEVICRFMLNHLLEIPNMSVNEIAEACYTSHPSIIRFTKELGYDGIIDFKDVVRDYLDEIQNQELRVHFPVKTMADDDEFRSTMEYWLERQSRYIVSSIMDLNRDQVRRFCQDIHDHKHVLLAGAGLSNVILELFRIELARCGKLVHNIGSDFEALSGYEKEDSMLLVLSMYGYLISDRKRSDSQKNLKLLFQESVNKSWMITLRKNLKSGPTDEMIRIGSDENSFEVTLNTMIVFFELVGECYQEMFVE